MCSRYTCFFCARMFGFNYVQWNLERVLANSPQFSHVSSAQSAYQSNAHYFHIFYIFFFSRSKHILFVLKSEQNTRRKFTFSLQKRTHAKRKLRIRWIITICFFFSVHIHCDTFTWASAYEFTHIDFHWFHFRGGKKNEIFRKHNERGAARCIRSR